MKAAQYYALARVYDELNRDVDYRLWADYIERVFERWLPAKPELVLDLACGTGAMTLELARRGYDMTALDLSEDMLNAARGKCDSAGVENVLLLRQDMANFELYGTVGAIVCCLDGVNYLTKTESLASCFACAHNYLDPDGLFVFDVNTPYKFRNTLAENTFVYDEEDAFCVWQSDFSEKTGICRFYLDVFARARGGLYERRTEVQRERSYSRRTIEKTLAEAGFELLCVSGGYDFDAPAHDAQRWHFTARAIKR